MGCVPQLGRVCCSVGGCDPSVGGCVPEWEGVSHCERLCPSVGGSAHVFVICVCGCGCGCPCHMYSWQTRKCICVFIWLRDASATYVAETSWNELLLIDWFCYEYAHQDQFATKSQSSNELLQYHIQCWMFSLWQCWLAILLWLSLWLKTGSTAKVNSTKWHIFSNGPKYLPAKISNITIMVINNWPIICNLWSAIGPWQDESQDVQWQHLLTSGTSGHLHTAISTPYNGVGICMHCVVVVVCGGVNVNWFYYWISTIKLAVRSIY